MKTKFFTVLLAGCFVMFAFQSEAQKSNILIEKGLAYLASTQSTSKGFTPGEGSSVDPENLYQMSKTPGDWGGAGITALCLQAFLQNGHNINDPVYGTVVQNAIDYLLGAQITSGGNSGGFGTWQTGYETGMAIVSLKLALETPLSGGGFIQDPLRQQILDAIDYALNDWVLYYVDTTWDAVSWRYDKWDCGQYSGDMSVNQWIYLALDAMDYEGLDIWQKIYNYLNNKKCTSGDYAYIGYQSCGQWARQNTNAGIWGAILTADHGIAAGSALKDLFFNYQDNYTLSQLIDASNIGSSHVYSGGGYYYYLYGFSKAMALGNKTIFAGGDWYLYLYNAIESQHGTDGNGNYYWNQWGGQGNNMETALALLCLQTQTIPENSTIVISLDTDIGSKDECFDFTVYDELGNAAGENGGVWFTNIPNSEWTSTTDSYYELTVELEESGNYNAEIQNTCMDPKTAELCYRSYLEGELTDEECFVLEDVAPLTTIGATGFVNAIGGLNVIIVVPPTPIPVMAVTPQVIGYNPFEYSQTYDFTFDVMETGGETPLDNINIFASDLTDQFGNVIPAENFTFDPVLIDVVPAGGTVTVDASLTTPASFSKDDVGLFIGNITAQTTQQAKGIHFEIGKPDMIIDPDAVGVPATAGATSFDIDFTGMVGADWEVTSDAAWATPDPVNGSGDAMVTVNYEANPTDVERVATLTITAPDALNPEATFTLTQEPAPFPFFTNVDLEGSQDMVTWWDANGNLEEGFRISLDYNIAEYYLTLGNETTTNVPLALDMYPFYLDPATVPDDFYTYWENRGVVEGATGWQGIMWDIINGIEPTFFIKVDEETKDQMFMLVDGLQYLFAGVEVFLQVPGDYPLGNYGYSGFVEGESGDMSEEITVMIEFYRPELLEAELIVSQDMIDWETAFGNLAEGYLVRLDEAVEHYYLDLGDETYSNYPLMNDMFPFFLDPESVPEGFFDYWAGRGVVEGATGWQGIMWDIINGNEPTFYIKVEDEIKDQMFTLVDGLQFLFGGVEEFLTVPGDYPLGTYMYSGMIVDEYGVPSDPIGVEITFASDIDQQIELQTGWLGISSFIIPEEPAMETVLAGIEEQMEIILSFGGFYWPSQNLNLIGDWNTYEGYKIKMNEPAVLEMFGFPAEPFVNLTEGLHYMPMLSPVPLSNQVFADMGDALMYAFNIQEGLIYWPEGGISTLEVLQPGIGYLVRLNEPVLVDFSSKEATSPQTVEPLVNNTPWNSVKNTGLPHLISIRAEALSEFETGDYVGVFTAEGQCAGMSMISDKLENLAVVAYGDEMLTTAKDGFASNETLNFKVYRPSTGDLANAEVIYQPGLNTGQFEEAGVSIISEFKADELGLNNPGTVGLNIYPNPSSGLVNVSIEGKATVRVTDARGRIVFGSQINGNRQIDLSGLRSGIYYIRVVHDEFSVIEKLVIK